MTKNPPPPDITRTKQQINAILAMYANYIQDTGGSDRFRMDEDEAVHKLVTLYQTEMLKLIGDVEYSDMGDNLDELRTKVQELSR